MKQIAIVSGKGGTGKTTVAAAFAELAAGQIVADCDVEAPNLHLVLSHRVKESKEYIGNKSARIDYTLCTNCGSCQEVCRYDSVHTLDIRKDSDAGSSIPLIDPKRCEGCAACVYACPVQAIKLYPEATGEIFLSETVAGNFAHAELYLAADGSGKLVTEVRQLARKAATTESKNILIDGSPGIGCTVISTITGCQQVLVVTEPTQSGKHDLERVLRVTSHFKVPAQVVINKWDINERVTKEIETVCSELKVPIIGRIPFDPMVPKAIANGHPITRYHTPASSALRTIWSKLAPELE